MKCPKCGEEMEPGFFMIEPEEGGIYAKWYGKDEERLLLGGEPIYQGSRYERAWIESLRCYRCNAVTMFLPEKKGKLGKEKGKRMTRPPF
jgi:hypothetical protein